MSGMAGRRPSATGCRTPATGRASPKSSASAAHRPRRRLRPGAISNATAEIGCDGVIVSNHGGRQLDQAPGSLDALPAIKAAVGDRMTVMLDSGVRRGADILIALCLGAQFCFFGRPTL